MPKPTAKLSPRQVRALRRRYARGETVMSLARYYRVGQSRIREAATGLTYKTVPGRVEPRPWPRDFRPEVHAGRQWAA